MTNVEVVRVHSLGAVGDEDVVFLEEIGETGYLKGQVGFGLARDIGGNSQLNPRWTELKKKSLFHAFQPCMVELVLSYRYSICNLTVKLLQLFT